MPSPQITRYVDMDLYDSSPQAIFEIGLNTLKERIPGWTPREGNVEVVLMESLAEMVSEAVYAINRVPDAVFQTLMTMFGVKYQEGQLPIGHFLFHLDTTAAITIPEGTEIALLVDGLNDPIIFKTDSEIQSLGGVGMDLIPAQCTGDTPTDAANGMVDSLPNRASMVSPIARVISVTLDPDFDPAVYDGQSPETDDEFFDRSASVISRANTSLVTGRDIQTFLNEQPVVGASTYEVDGFGYKISAYGNNQPLTVDQRDALIADIYQKVVPGTSLVFFEPVVANLFITASITVQPDYSPTSVVSHLKTVLASEWSSKGNYWNTVPTVTEVAMRILQSAGVKDIVGAVVVTGGGAAWNDLTVLNLDDITITVV